jgi:hypothetical protein
MSKQQVSVSSFLFLSDANTTAFILIGLIKDYAVLSGHSILVDMVVGGTKKFLRTTA